MSEVKKAIIIATDLGVSHLPLIKILNKELLPLVDRPLIDFVVSEAKDSEIEKIIFVLSENKKNIANYFKKDIILENIFKKNKVKKGYFKILKEEEERFKDISFSFIYQHLVKGDGDSIMKAKNYIKNEGFAVLSSGDVFESKTSCLNQLKRIFETSRKPIIALKRISKNKFFSCFTVSTEKIANKLYKIKEIKKNSSIGESFSDLAIAGRYILTPEVFKYLKIVSNNKEEISIPQILNAMIKDGKMVYGYEVSGEWLNCDEQIDWLKANLYLSLKHPKYGPALKAFLKNINYE